MSEQDLDARIRALVGRAVADAPTAPEIDPATALEPRSAERGRRPGRAWWVGGGAALLAAAAAVTTVVLVADTDDRISTPSDTAVPTVPTVAPTTPPTGEQVATAGPDGSSSTADPVAPADPTGFVVAGPGGVAVLDGPTEVRRLDQPAEVAHATPGGAVIFQPARTTVDGDPGDPLIWRPDGTVDRLLGVLGERQSYRLYDVEAVAGVPTVLYGVSTRGAGEGAATDVAGYREVLHALTMTPGGWTDAVLHEMRTWESGYSDLTLSRDGLVVGETSHSVSHSLFSVTVPGSPAAASGPLTPAALGLRDVYGDEVSPRSIVVSPGGDVVAWVEGSDVVVRTVATGDERRWGVAGLADLAVRGLEVRPVDGGSVRLVLRTGWPGSAQGPASFDLTLTAGGATSMVPIGGTGLASFVP